MAAVSRQVPKTLREGTLPVIRRAWLQEHFFPSVSSCFIALYADRITESLQQSRENKAQAFWLEDQEGRPRESRKWWESHKEERHQETNPEILSSFVHMWLRT